MDRNELPLATSLPSPDQTILPVIIDKSGPVHAIKKVSISDLVQMMIQVAEKSAVVEVIPTELGLKIKTK